MNDMFVVDDKEEVTKIANSPCDIRKRGSCNRAEVHGNHFYTATTINIDIKKYKVI